MGSMEHKKTDQILQIFYETFFEHSTKQDRLIFKVAHIMRERGYSATVAQHRGAIRRIKGKDYANYAYSEYMLKEAGYSQICDKCGGTGRFGFTTGTCWGCSGAGYVKNLSSLAS